MPLNRRVKVGIEIGFLIGTAIVIALGVSIGFTAYLGNPKHPYVAVTTGSMIPIYNGFFELHESDDIIPFQGDILIVRNIPTSSIQVGDVIIFSTAQVADAVVHRVVAIWEENGTYFLKTKGDNVNQPDNWSDGITTGDDIHGVVVFRVPHIGWFLLVVQTPFGRILLLAIAFLVLFFGDDSEEEEDGKDSKTIQANDNNRKTYYKQEKFAAFTRRLCLKIIH